MAPSQPPPDFNAFINADRERRKNQALAQEIFSKNRRASAPGVGPANRKPTVGGSLASRVGIQKRTTSSARSSPRPAGNVNSEWTHDLHTLNNPPTTRNAQNPPRGPRAGRNNNQGDRLRNALNNSASSPALNSQFNIVGKSKPTAGMSIRGLAGPYLVVAKNLAPGTTAADIESAMTPVGGVVISCVIIAEKPNVIAELVFETKEGADNVVDTFNNQNADGNILHVYHKSGPISSSHRSLPTSTLKAPAVRSITPLGPRAAEADRSDDNRSDHRGGSDRYVQRERSHERGRRDYDRDDVMDGSYGFEDRMETDDQNSSSEKGRGRGLYSDTLIGNNRGGGRGYNRDRGRANAYDRGRGFR